MPANIDAAFKQFLKGIDTTPTETAAAASHRASIKSKLEDEFGMTSFFRTGSFGNGTNVARHSDVDYFAVIPGTRLRANSSTSLAQVANTFRDRFPNTPIRVNAPGVRIAFGLDGAEATEIVPVDETGVTKLGYRAFDIPDGNGGWKFSAPDSHNAWVSAIDKGLDGKVKPLIRLIKAWNFKRGASIRSFYLELWIANYAQSQQSIIYSLDVSIVLQRLFEAQLADFNDPRFPDDGFMINACNTANQLADALSELENAANWAYQANEHERAGRVRQAFERWDLVFDYEFPAYSPI